MDGNIKSTFRMHIDLISIAIIFVLALVFTIFIVLVYIYGGICTCVKDLRALICMCLTCRRSGPKDNKDSDQGDGINVSSTTLFDAMVFTDVVINSPLRAPVPKRRVDTLRQPVSRQRAIR